jgi:hypothetical protein
VWWGGEGERWGRFNIALQHEAITLQLTKGHNMRKTETYIDNDGHVACAMCGAVNPSDPCQTCIDHEAKMQQRLADQRAASAVFSQQLVSVKRTTVKNGWQFVGTLSNGETIMLRTKATRPYTMAAIHDLCVVSKFDMPDVRGFVTFHNASPKPGGNWDKILRIVQIND